MIKHDVSSFSLGQPSVRFTSPAACVCGCTGDVAMFSAFLVPIQCGNAVCGRLVGDADQSITSWHVRNEHPTCWLRKWCCVVFGHLGFHDTLPLSKPFGFHMHLIVLYILTSCDCQFHFDFELISGAHVHCNGWIYHWIRCGNVRKHRMLFLLFFVHLLFQSIFLNSR